MIKLSKTKLFTIPPALYPILGFPNAPFPLRAPGGHRFSYSRCLIRCNLATGFIGVPKTREIQKLIDFIVLNTR